VCCSDLLERGQDYRSTCQPAAVVGTEVRYAFDQVSRQRTRWQRGTLEVLARHRTMIGNPAHGRIGLVALPYYAIFEALGPLLELAGLVVTVPALALGLLDWRVAEPLFLAAILYGTLISIAAVLLEELTCRRYLHLGDVLKLFAAALLENFGYRQMTMWWRLRGIVDFCRGRKEWGVMTRKGLSPV
jgi:cellulose synthase/poly-beta-1,6-N-acetylglucosamine synthase-like glycosyltransferase